VVAWDFRLAFIIAKMTLPPPLPKIPFTRTAYEQLQSDFDRLTEERKQTMVRLQTAREMGDLSENGAYKYAKIELGNINHELRRLKHLLDRGEVVEKTGVSTFVEFGSEVTVQHGKKTSIFTIVSHHESDPRQGKLSTSSPLGQALAGKKVGEEVKVEAPAGQVTYRITAIK
jgi:transcription elongation factor GreA